MKYIVTSIRDRIAEQYLAPQFWPNSNMAIRSFTDACNRAQDDNMLYKFPDDYELYELGSFDADEGVFENTKPRVLAFGRDARRS